MPRSALRATVPSGGFGCGQFVEARSTGRHRLRSGQPVCGCRGHFVEAAPSACDSTGDIVRRPRCCGVLRVGKEVPWFHPGTAAHGVVTWRRPNLQVACDRWEPSGTSERVSGR